MKAINVIQIKENLSLFMLFFSFQGPIASKFHPDLTFNPASCFLFSAISSTISSKEVKR